MCDEGTLYFTYVDNVKACLVIDRLFYFGGFLVLFLANIVRKCRNARICQQWKPSTCVYLKGVLIVLAPFLNLCCFSKNPLTCCTAGLSALFTLENIQTSKCLFCLSNCYIKHCWWKGYVRCGTFYNLSVGYQTHHVQWQCDQQNFFF